MRTIAIHIEYHKGGFTYVVWWSVKLLKCEVVEWSVVGGSVVGWSVVGWSVIVV